MEICERSGKVGEGFQNQKSANNKVSGGLKAWSFCDKVIIEYPQCNFSRENLL